MCIFNTNNIAKKDFLKLDEIDIMFITNPGRMGNEDSLTFILRNDNEFIAYEVSGLVYPNEENNISLEEITKQFPKWYKGWKHANDKSYEGKYKYLYMGFGNGLSIDNSIYSVFEPYLNDLVEEYLEKMKEEEKESLRYVAVYNTWKEALIKMVKDNNMIIK